MELNETVEMMQSADYKERFKAEYYQLMIRMEKLAAMFNRWESGELDFEPTCPYDMLAAQLASMRSYIFILRMRAEIENIKL